MARINFDFVQAGGVKRDDFVNYFSLKNDGDEAIVRIMCSSLDELEMLTTHNIMVNDRHRRINCIRDPRELLEKCPLCATGNPVRQEVFIKLLQYTKSADGKIIAEPRVWVRPASYATIIRDLLNEYGDLSECIFKIKRSGKAGDTRTKYSVLFGNPALYSESVYPKLTDAFKVKSFVGNLVMDRDYDEIVYFLENGEFEYRKKNTDATVNKDATVAVKESPIESYINEVSAPQQSTATTIPEVLREAAPQSANAQAVNAPVQPTDAPGSVVRPVRRYY